MNIFDAEGIKDIVRQIEQAFNDTNNRVAALEAKAKSTEANVADTGWKAREFPNAHELIMDIQRNSRIDCPCPMRGDHFTAIEIHPSAQRVMGHRVNKGSAWVFCGDQKYCGYEHAEFLQISEEPGP